MPTGTEEYYAQRAAEYDQVYAKEERQEDLAALTVQVRSALAGRRVLDVAAGTGFWSERYANDARSVTLCDASEETLVVARGRWTWPDTVTFEHGDAFALADVPGTFDAAFVGFFWSHVDLEHLDGFLDGLVARLEPGAVVVVVDNAYVGGSNHPITRTDEAGNTYQRRRLADGTAWEVRKNFPAPEEVRERLVRHDPQASVDTKTYFWTATWRTPGGS